MRKPGKELLLALALIAGGTLAFLVFLAVTGDGDDRPFGLLDWIVGGVTIGPGFGALIKSRQQQGR